MAMKLAATTLGCPEWSFEKILEEFERLGFEGIEIRGLEGEMDAGKIRRFLPENAEDTLRRVRERGLKLIGFGTSCSFHDPEQFEGSVRQGKESIDVCRRMGIPWIRVFGDRFPAEYPREETIARVIRGLRELCAYADGKGVEVYLEIHGEFNTIEAVRPVLEGMDGRKNFGILWDIEHSDRAYGDGVEPFYRLIRPFIRHVHIKDYLRATADAPFRLCMAGAGEIPIPTLAGWLRRDGYAGYLSFEWEKKWVPELPEAEEAFPAYAAYMKSLLKTEEEQQ